MAGFFGIEVFNDNQHVKQPAEALPKFVDAAGTEVPGKVVPILGSVSGQVVPAAPDSKDTAAKTMLVKFTVTADGKSAETTELYPAFVTSQTAAAQGAYDADRAALTKVLDHAIKENPRVLGEVERVAAGVPGIVTVAPDKQ